MSTYGKKTKHFEIPVLAYKDRIDPEVEMRKYTIIENMLIAGTYGLSEVVFDDGSYVVDQEGDTFTVRLTAGGSFPSAKGLVGGFYFHAPSEVKWEDLKKGFEYYLYIRATAKTPHMSESVRMVSSTRRLEGRALLMAYINLRDEVAVLNTEPDGKVYSSDVARHASDSSNPHGMELVQETLRVTKRLELTSDSVIQIGDTDMPVDVFASLAAEVGGRRVERVDFVSGGAVGVRLKSSGKVFGVQANRRGPITESLGEVAFGYFGEDQNVDSDDECFVYNEDGEGIPMRAIIICG